MSIKTEVRATTGAVAYRTILTNDRSTFIADERSEHGGANEGATPDELLCMSLAACTSITLRMYAVRKNWDIGEITVTVEMERNEAAILFKRNISVSNKQSAEINERLLVVANKCPIHKSLSSINKIESNIM